MNLSAEELDEWRRQQFSRKYQVWINGDVHASSDKERFGVSCYFNHVMILKPTDIVELRVDGIVDLSSCGEKTDPDKLLGSIDLDRLDERVEAELQRRKLDDSAM